MIRNVVAHRYTSTDEAISRKQMNFLIDAERNKAKEIVYSTDNLVKPFSMGGLRKRKNIMRNTPIALQVTAPVKDCHFNYIKNEKTGGTASMELEQLRRMW